MGASRPLSALLYWFQCRESVAKEETGHFGRVKTSFGLTILGLVWVVGRKKRNWSIFGASRPLSASLYWFLCRGSVAKNEPGHFGRVKASFGLTILVLV